MSTLIEALAAQLERPREITVQVADYLIGNYDLDNDSIGGFLDSRLSGLEDYEHDLILSPLFTPKMADQAIFAEVLGKDAVPRDQWPRLIEELLARPTHGNLITADRKSHKIVLRAVTLERYVHRLRLDGSIPDSVYAMLEALPQTDRPTLKAIARRAAWETGQRRGILSRYLTSTAARGGYRLSDAAYLLELAESYKPADVPALLNMIPRWRQSLKDEIDTAANPKPFFTPQIQGEHGGDRDQRNADARRIDAKKIELAALDRIQQILAD